MEICRKQLVDLGFIQVTKDLYMKELPVGIQIFRDYRNGFKKSYAYKNKEKLNPKLFKELRAIEIIEERMAGSLSLYI